MKNLKQAGYPLLFVSLALFSLAKRSEGMWLYWLAAGAMLLGMVLFLLSALSPSEKGAGESPGGAAAAVDNFPRASRYGRRGYSSAGVEVKQEVPGWVYLLGGTVTVIGMIGFFFSPNGVHPRSVITFSMIPGGVLLILLGHAVYGGAIGLRNLLRGAVALLGFLLILAGIFTGVLLFAGNFDVGERLPWAAGAVMALLAGMALAYYGFKYQQGAEGVAIGRELGFKDAESGLFARDGVYDSVGEMNGAEIKFNVEQEQPQRTKSGHTIPARFRLEILCACANARQARLEVRPAGLLGMNFTGLPKLPPLEYWDGYNVMSDSPDAVVKALQEAKAGTAVFLQEAGFQSLSLEGGELKAVFEQDGYAGTGFVRSALNELSRLSLALG